MRFLTDQDVDAIRLRLLSSLGHDVVTAAQLGLSQTGDADLLRVAQEQGRIFVTRDRDFAGLIFMSGMGSERKGYHPFSDCEYLVLSDGGYFQELGQNTPSFIPWTRAILEIKQTPPWLACRSGRNKARRL
jgi:Domain of unknown function (DUF5615)